MKALQNVQLELKAPKNQRNTFGGYNYRSAEDILEAVKPLLEKHGLTMTLSDEIVEVGGRVYVKATAKVTDGKEEVLVTAYAREAETKKGMDDSQITGTASSYARKYALNGLYLIDDTKDADTDQYREQTEGVRHATAKQLEVIKSVYGDNPDAMSRIMNHYHVTDIGQLTIEQASQVIESIRN